MRYVEDLVRKAESTVFIYIYIIYVCALYLSLDFNFQILHAAMCTLISSTNI